MPRGFMDDLEGEVSDKKLHKCGLGEDIFSADPDCEDALLLNMPWMLWTQEYYKKHGSILKDG